MDCIVWLELKCGHGVYNFSLEDYMEMQGPDNNGKPLDGNGIFNVKKNFTLHFYDGRGDGLREGG